MSRNIRERIPLFKPDDGKSANDVVSIGNKKIISFDLCGKMVWRKRWLLLGTSEYSASLKR
nr:hypothetical protein [Geobacter hydrogenophilus]